MNKSQIMGRLVKDPELAYTQNDKAYCRYTLAVNRRMAKEGQQKADFIRCLSWNKGAEFVSKYFKKGDMIAIIGRIATDSYDDRDGKKVFTTEIVAEEHYFTGAKSSGSNNYTPPNLDDVRARDDNGFYPVNEDDDELPF